MAKQLFKTTEKSNFILNMTEETYSGLASKALVLMCLIVSLFTIPSEFSDEIGYSLVSGGLAVAGVICMILALIAVMKKYVDKKMLFPICAFGFMLVWGLFSLLDSYDKNVSFYGFNGRGEGLLALIFYFGFFITGLTLKREKALNTFINGIIATGILNSVWGLMQVFVPQIPCNYRHVVGISDDINAASGLAQSPIFLAMLLSLSLTSAILRFVMGGSKKQRIFGLCCSAVFAFVMMFTYSVVGIFGAVFAVIVAAAAVFITKAPKIRLAGIGAVILPAVLAVGLAAGGIVGDRNAYKLSDGSIMWMDSFNRLSSSGIYTDKAVDIKDSYDVYYFLNTKTKDIIGDYPLFGTGPENLVYPQLYASAEIEKNFNTFDKNYNEYLYTAATRGVPSLIAFVAILLSVIIIGWKKLKNGQKGASSAVLFALMICGVLLFFIGNSNIVFSPIFWAAAGASCASLKKSGKGGTAGTAKSAGNKS
ncbi:MAG: O-antigen ligase family protein [Ruminococcus sp.]